MKVFKIALWIILLWLFQSLFARFIAIYGIKPELLFIFSLGVAYLEKNLKCYITVGIICGILTGLSSTSNMIFYILLFSISMIGVLIIKEYIYDKSILLIIPITFILTFIENSAYFYFNKYIYAKCIYSDIFLSVILPTVIYNTMLSGVIAHFIKKTIYTEKIRYKFK